MIMGLVGVAWIQGICISMWRACYGVFSHGPNDIHGFMGICIKRDKSMIPGYGVFNQILSMENQLSCGYHNCSSVVIVFSPCAKMPGLLPQWRVSLLTCRFLVTSDVQVLR